jgi:hypothetical protein
LFGFSQTLFLPSPLIDYCEERVPSYIEASALRNALGSLTAGVISGYLSHVVHNLSALKLMDPSKSYAAHFMEYVKKSADRIPGNIPFRNTVAVASALVFPRGVHIRTAQIVGSFIILNGTINAMQRAFNQKM